MPTVFSVFPNRRIWKRWHWRVSRLKHFFRFIGLPVNFKELGIENPDIDRLADSLHRNKGEFVGNYVKLTKQDSKEIYRLAL